jgi:hypothetical protein
MKLIIFFISLMINFTWADSYKGPKEAGVENYTCGVYRIKGVLSVKNFEGLEFPLYFLRIYPDTTREYSVQLLGLSLEVFNSLNRPVNVVVEGQVNQKALGKEAKFFVKNRPRLTTEMKLFEDSVELIKKSPCRM